MDASNLAAAIQAVCPLVSVRVVTPTDRATWSFIPDPSATQPQIDAANNIIATLDPTVKNIIAFDAFVRRWTDPEYALLMQKRATAIGAGNVALVKQWDLAMIVGKVDLNTAVAVNFKAALVSAAILTQARADVIFA